ncbi:MAG: hypothetical protein J3K34DRAFT_429092, partial [Monoraphidium minutum]
MGAAWLAELLFLIRFPAPLGARTSTIPSSQDAPLTGAPPRRGACARAPGAARTRPFPQMAPAPPPGPPAPALTG